MYVARASAVAKYKQVSPITCEHTSGADTAQLGQWKDVTCVNILVVLILHS